MGSTPTRAIMDAKNTKLCAYLSGGDWYDASIEFLQVPVDCDLTAAKAEWREWYKTVYLPSFKKKNGKLPHKTFVAWLIDNWDVEYADEDAIEVIDDDY